jgi:rubrerythrin
MRDDVEIREYSVKLLVSEFGKTRILIVCPFCGEEVWAYKWSLAGSGKKCPQCGAKHASFASVKRKVNK